MKGFLKKNRATPLKEDELDKFLKKAENVKINPLSLALVIYLKERCL